MAAERRRAPRTRSRTTGEADTKPVRAFVSALMRHSSMDFALSTPQSPDNSIRSASHSATNDVVYALAVRRLTEDSKVLDLGAGKGYMSRRLGRWFAARGRDPARNVIACDVDHARFAATEIPFQQFDANAGLPFGDDTFDLIVAVEVFEHMANIYQQFDECRRVLKDGGLLVFSVPNIAHTVSRLKFLLTGFHDLYMPPSIDPKNAGRICGHIMPLTFAYLGYGLRAAGFHGIQCHLDKTKKAAVVLTILLYPFIRCCSWLYRQKVRRYDARVFAENDSATRLMNSWSMLTARSCIVEAIK